MYDQRFFRMWEFYLLISKYSFINMGKYKVYPDSGFIEIGLNGLPSPFLAKKIKKKRIGKDLILLEKKVSFDKKMNCIIED